MEVILRVSRRETSTALGMTMLAALLVFVILASAADAEWKIAGAQREIAPNDLVEHWQTVLENGETSERFDLHFVVFQARRATIQVIDQPNEPRRDLAQVMMEKDCLAGVNGGYFDREEAPLGLLLSDARVIAPLRKARLLTGVLMAAGKEIDIVRATRFSTSAKVRAALQCGPFLVERATIIPGLNDSQRARRTFAAVDGKGRAALGVCSAISLAQLSKILCLTNVAGEMKIVRALNLDGGSSSAFWFAGREGPFSIPEQKTVRDFVAIVPRENR